MNYDAASSRSTVVVGVVIRDWEGSVIGWKRSSVGHVAIAEVAEALRSCLGVRHAPCFIEGDCSNVVKELQDPDDSMAAIGNIIAMFC